MLPPAPRTLILSLFAFAALSWGCDPSEPTPDNSVVGAAELALSVGDCLTAAVGGRVTFCHATSSTTNPYNVITVSTNACQNAHVNHAGDVLPDTNGDCCPTEARDCAGQCYGPATLDCAGVCDGSAEIDCGGVCDGSAVSDPFGGCCETEELDCAGQCAGSAVEDCAGVCGGQAEDVDVVHYTTNAGVFRWSSGDASSAPAQVSSFPSYAIAVSPDGEIVVGTGGVEATAQGLATPGVYTLDGAGAATLLASTAAEDLQFSPSGGLFASNATGIYSIDEWTGIATRVSTNPTSQFAFETDTSVVTTNGTVYASAFTRRTDRINLTTATTTLINGDGGEDIHVDENGEIFLCGQGGIFEVLPTGAFFRIYNGRKVFNFGLGQAGDLYIGNTVTYGTSSWAPSGFYSPSDSAAAISSADINALVVTGACE